MAPRAAAPPSPRGALCAFAQVQLSSVLPASFPHHSSLRNASHRDRARPGACRVHPGHSRMVLFSPQRNGRCLSLGSQSRKYVGSSNKAGGFSAVPQGTLGAHFTLGAAGPCLFLSPPTWASPPAVPTPTLAGPHRAPPPQRGSGRREFPPLRPPLSPQAQALHFRCLKFRGLGPGPTQGRGEAQSPHLSCTSADRGAPGWCVDRSPRPVLHLRPCAHGARPQPRPGRMRGAPRGTRPLLGDRSPWGLRRVSQALPAPRLLSDGLPSRNHTAQ